MRRVSDNGLLTGYSIGGAVMGATIIAFNVGFSSNVAITSLPADIRDSSHLRQHSESCIAEVTGRNILDNPTGMTLSFDRAAIATCMNAKYEQTKTSYMIRQTNIKLSEKAHLGITLTVAFGLLGAIGGFVAGVAHVTARYKRESKNSPPPKATHG